MELTILNKPAFQQVLQKVRTHGLHKFAESIYGEELTLKTAVQRIATQQVYNRLKREKIASGLKALAQIESFKKKAGMFRLPTGVGQNIQKMIPEAAEGLAAKLPQELSAARGGIEGLPLNLSKKNPMKQTIMGADTPAMQQLPPIPPEIANAQALFGQYGR